MIAFIWFMHMWNKRTVARDKQYTDTMKEVLKLLRDCHATTDRMWILIDGMEKANRTQLDK